MGRTKQSYYMMTSSNGSIFRVTGHLYGEFTGTRWVPHTKASDAAQMASNAENVSIWWRHHDTVFNLSFLHTASVHIKPNVSPSVIPISPCSHLRIYTKFGMCIVMTQHSVIFCRPCTMASQICLNMARFSPFKHWLIYIRFYIRL